MTRFPIILRSRLIATAGFAIATSFGGEGFAVDASVIEADASRYHGKAPGDIDWSALERQTRAVAEFLTAFDEEGADAERKPPKVISDPNSRNWPARVASSATG
jgi:hypothetical protein